MRCTGLLALAAVLFGGGFSIAQDFTVEMAPPVVVKSVPEAGMTDVDPALSEIKVTFSKDMRDGRWSWAQRGIAAYPEITGKIHYLEDKRTCVLPVKLKPGTTYLINVNSEKFNNFRDLHNQPSMPYTLVFKTKGEPEAAKADAAAAK